MYKIESVKINNFWRRFNAECEFNHNVNIIIGKNGTGKTTFMNILNAILSVDIEGINNSDFESAVIILKDGKSKKTINVKKSESLNSPFFMVEYQITRKKYYVRVISSDDRRFAPYYRKKAIEDAEEVRSELRKIVSLSSLSVYRLRSGDTQDFRDRQINQTPVDYRLSQLLQNLTRFQLELSQKARDVALELQREVLASILYNKETIESYKPEALLQFNKETERSRLISAYNQLNAMTSKIRRKIDIHVEAIDKTVNELKTANAGRIDFSALEALRRSQQIIKLSLDSEFKTSLIYEPVNKFIDILSEFIPDKKFSFNGGQLEVSNTYDGLNYDSLSSDEKQLLILLIETLLQKSQPYVFLTDEPELSLHIAWQRQIIPAILRLNPNAQVIAATHSPEVASKYKSSILNMENIINA